MIDEVGGAPLGAPPANAGLVLAPHIKSVALGTETILLDLRRDKYLSASTPGLRRIIEGAPQSGDQMLCAVLWRDGILSERGAVRAATRPVKPALRLGSTPVAFVAACLWARHVIRARALERAMLMLAASRQGAAASTSAKSRFLDWRVWYPARSVCLFDSLALCHFLAGAGAGFELVFGVRAEPFAAHCWVEWSGSILNDEEEYCSAFTEIMRV